MVVFFYKRWGDPLMNGSPLSEDSDGYYVIRNGSRVREDPAVSESWTHWMGSLAGSRSLWPLLWADKMKLSLSCLSKGTCPRKGRDSSEKKTCGWHPLHQPLIYQGRGRGHWIPRRENNVQVQKGSWKSHLQRRERENPRLSMQRGPQSKFRKPIIRMYCTTELLELEIAFNKNWQRLSESGSRGTDRISQEPRKQRDPVI